MLPRNFIALLGICAGVLVAFSFNGTTSAAENASAEEAALRQLSTGLVQAFNDRKTNDLSACFLPEAELVDDAGNLHEGRDAILAVCKALTTDYPDAKMKLAVDSIRLVGEALAIENGVRTISSEAKSTSASNLYTVLYAKRGDAWRIAMVREKPADATPRDQLEPLAWLVGQWVDEDADAAISMSCRWEDGGSFLVADFVAKVQGEVVLNSKQRIGWDPQAKAVRSWVFDSDGGYGEGRWTDMGDFWIVKSTAVLPDGATGSATLYFEPEGEDRFLMKGFDRIVAGETEPDFEATIVRRPPKPAK